VRRIAPLLLALTAASACNGKSIHLGDGWLDGGGTCATAARVNANEVLWIGDSWILVTGSQHTRVRDLARAAGTIGPNDDYVVRAVAASGLAAIANQYAMQEAGPTKVKVIVMFLYFCLLKNLAKYYYLNLQYFELRLILVNLIKRMLMKMLMMKMRVIL